ncbi:MAG: hypothetical protein M0011_12265 [Elusimicrobia bacterium]|nr:hypothetical protein [Elusimicrobiota bacterium]
MGWSIKDWLCGYRAEREDGEMVFIYSRPAWGTGMSGIRRFYELRSRGELIGRISSESSLRPLVRAEWLAGPGHALNENDLLEIACALPPRP